MVSTGSRLIRESSLRTRSEVEQETQCASGLEHDLVTDDAELADQTLLGHGLDVLALRIAHIVESRPSSVDLYMRRQASIGGRERDNDNDAGPAFIQQISGNDERRAPARLLPADRIAEVDQPHLAAVSAHDERSLRVPLSILRSASISCHALGSARSTS